MVYSLLVLSLQLCYDIFIVLLYYMISVVKHYSQTTFYDKTILTMHYYMTVKACLSRSSVQNENLVLLSTSAVDQF